MAFIQALLFGIGFFPVGIPAAGLLAISYQVFMDGVDTAEGRPAEEPAMRERIDG